MYYQYDPALLGHIWDGPVYVCAITVFGHNFNMVLVRSVCVSVNVDD